MSAISDNLDEEAVRVTVIDRADIPRTAILVNADTLQGDDRLLWGRLKDGTEVFYRLEAVELDGDDVVITSASLDRYGRTPARVWRVCRTTKLARKKRGGES
jgi:hypothetical protein